MEEIEDRLGDRMNEILDIVKASLSSRPTSLSHTTISQRQAFGMNEDRPEWDDGDVVVEDDFDDQGAGAGIEGDLEMGDED